MEHSRLLKFLVPSRPDITMAETPSFKVQYEYQNPNNVESEVPGSQNIREVTDKLPDESTDGANTQNGGYTITRSSYTEHSATVEGTKITRTTVTLSSNSTNEELVTEEKTEVMSEKIEGDGLKPKTKIPKLKFRQAAERVKRERRLARTVSENETHIPIPKTSNTKLSRISKIPPPTSKPYVIKRESREIELIKPDDAFDKLYEEIVENTQTEIEIKHPEIIENKFEEIIHDYDENRIQPINVEKIRQSRIPSLRRRTSEHVDSKTEKVVLSEKTKTRSLPRLKEISMRVKADDESLGQTQFSRTLSTETTSSGGQKSTVETRIIKQPGSDTKVYKINTTETVTKNLGGINKDYEGTESVTVHKTIRVTSQSGESMDVDEKVKHVKMESQTEDIMKHSLDEGNISFVSKNIENNNELSQEKTEVRQVIKRLNDKSTASRENVKSEESKTVIRQIKSNVSEATSNIQSDKSPTIERSTTITRVVSSSNDNERVNELDGPKSLTKEKDNITRTTTERKYLDGPNSPTIERSTTISRVISSGKDVKVQEIEDFKSSATTKGGIIERITTERKYIDVKDKSPTIEGSISYNINEGVKQKELSDVTVSEHENIVQRISAGRKFFNTQNKSHSIERSENISRTMPLNDGKIKKIEHSKSLTEEKETSVDKDIARKTIINVISKVSENREIISEEPATEDREVNVTSYEIEKEVKAEEITTVPGKVGKIIHKIDSNEATIEIKKRGVDDLPKKKSILSKIAMFERQDVEDRMPLKKPSDLPKLLIKHPSTKTTHLHTPTIVEEVLKSQGTSPGTAQILSDDSQQAFGFDYKTNTEIKQSREIGQIKETNYKISTLNPISNKDYNPDVPHKVGTLDYQIRGDEYDQIVQLTKLKSTSITHDNKESIQMPTTVDYKQESIINTTIQAQRDADTGEEHTNTTIDKVTDGQISESAATLDFKFKEVKKLASQYEQKVDVSKDTSSHIKVVADIGNESLVKQGAQPPKISDYNINIVDNKDSNYHKVETSQLISSINNISGENITSLRPKSIHTMDYKFNINEEIPKYEVTSPETSTNNAFDGKIVIPDTPDLTDFEYTFKDVKQLAVEYEQRAKLSKSLESLSRADSLSPTLQNYDLKSSDESNNSKPVMVDAPVIFIAPKIGFQGEENADLVKQDQKVEIATSHVKEASVHTAERTEFTKQISTEYKQETVESRNFSTQTSNTSVSSATTVEAGGKNVNHIKSINELAEQFNDTSNYDVKVVETRNKIPYVTQSSTKHYESAISNKQPGDLNMESNKTNLQRNISTETRTEITKDGYTEVKTVKSKGYVIKHEGHLAYAQIQDDDYTNNLEIPNDAPELPKTPPPRAISTVTTERFQSVEEKKKYYADVDINTVLKGKVSRLISRMTSLEQQAADKRNINVKEMPRKMSVLEKVAMYEKKISTGHTEFSYIGRTRIVTPKVEVHKMTEEQYEERIMELKSARLTYGMIENMPQIMLRNGVEMPVLALGTALLDQRLISHIVAAAIDLGYRAIDTAYIYGNEKEIGEAIRAKIADGTVRREELFIISKLWSTFHRTDLVEKACRASLEAMGLDYFDLYLIHNPMSFKEGGDAIPKIATVIQYSQFDYLDAWYGMEQLMTKGLVRSIGVSNFNSAQLQRILDKAKIKPTVNQVECHPYLSQLKLEAFCEDRDIKLSCFGVLGSKGTPAAIKTSLAPVIDDPLVQVMASGLNVSPAQLLIRYQLDSGRNAVVKSSSAKHLWDNLQAVTLNLTQGQIDALHALNRNKRIFTFKGMGDTHKNYPFKNAF